MEANDTTGGGGLFGSLERLLTRGIDAYADAQVARYTSNDPTPYNRGNADYSAPAGSPAFETLVDTLRNPVNLLLLAAAGVLTVVLVKRL